MENREILFRGKRLDNGEWVEGYFCDSDCDHPLGETVRRANIIDKDGWWLAVDPSTVGQYTGLTDKNGVKIFEGDIVKGLAYSQERVGVIVWIEEIASFGVRYVKGTGGLCQEPTAWENSSILKAIQRWKLPNEFQAEVIGNIHDDPELLASQGGEADQSGLTGVMMPC